MKLSDVHKAIANLEAAMDKEGFVKARASISIESSRDRLHIKHAERVLLWFGDGDIKSFGRGDTIHDNLSAAYEWIAEYNQPERLRKRATAELEKAVEAARAAGVDVEGVV